MSANSVLPPLSTTTRPERSEYFAGIARNELSECQSWLPRLNSRRRSSRASGLLSCPRFETSSISGLSRCSCGLRDVAAGGVLDFAEIAAKTRSAARR